MSERGFISLTRGILDHPVIGAGERYSDFEAWVWLLFEAAWKPHRVRVTNGRAAGVLQLERGQLSHAQSYMAKAWNWTPKRVRTFLYRLENAGQIARQTGHLQTLITICNYGHYQNPLSSRGQQTDRQSGRHRAGKGREEEQVNKVTKEIGGYSPHELHNDFLKAIGTDPDDPACFGFYHHIAALLSRGFTRETILAGAMRAMAGKHRPPPWGYFAKCIENENAERSTPARKEILRVKTMETNNEKSNIAQSLKRHIARLDAGNGTTSGELLEDHAWMLPDRRGP